MECLFVSKELFNQDFSPELSVQLKKVNSIAVNPFLK